MEKRIFPLIIMGLGITFLSAYFVLLTTVSESIKEQSLSQDKVITVAAVGDIMMGTTYPYTNLPPEDGKYLFSEARDILRKADIAFGNLEGPLCDKGYPVKRIKKGRSYVFRTPTRFVYNLVDAGFDVLSLANNHARDFGYYGMNSTKNTLKKAKIKYSSKDGEIAEFEIKGIKIGIIALSTGAPPRSVVYPNKALKEIDSLAQHYDILIVSVHGGKEGTSALHIKNEFEYFLGEPRGNLVKFAHDAIEKGADLILMHGPHVPRAVEIYKERLIAYSLGNFCTYGGMNLSKETGIAPLLWIELNRKGKFLKGRIYSFIQFPPGGPKRDEEEKAFNLIKKLSQEDFPNTSPLFDSAGIILPR